MPNIICISSAGFNLIDVFTIDVDTNKATIIFIEPDITIDKFSEIPLNNVKGVLFNFDGIETEYKSVIAKRVENYLKPHKIPFYCCSWQCIVASATLLALIDEFGEDVLADDMEIITCIDEKEYQNENIVKREKYFYINSFHRNFLSFVEHAIPCIKAAKIFITCSTLHPWQAITPKQRELQQIIINHLKTKNIVIFTKAVEDYINKAIVAKLLHLADRKPSKYNVANTGVEDYGIGLPVDIPLMASLKPKYECMKKFLIKIASNEIIPLKKSFVNYEKFKHIVFYKSHGPGFIGIPKFAVDNIGTTVTLSIDIYFMPNVESKMTNKNIKFGTMITSHDNKFFVETFENGTLMNIGLNNIPFVISFAEGKILIGKDALNVKEKFNSYVITDLMKIIKTDPAKLKADPKWGFELLHKENSKILLEFDTFRGRRKATPPFLFAFFIRWAVKNVEFISKNREFPKTIVLVIKNLDDRIRKNLMEACKWAKLDPKNVQIHEYKIVEIKE